MISPMVELAAAAASGNSDLMSIVLRNLPVEEQADIAKIAASSGLRVDDTAWLYIGAVIWTHKDADSARQSMRAMEQNLQEAAIVAIGSEIGKMLQRQSDRSLTEFDKALSRRIHDVADKAGTVLFSRIGATIIGALFFIALGCAIGGMILGQHITRMTPCGYVKWQNKYVFMCRAPTPRNNESN